MNNAIKDILERPVFERLREWANIGTVQTATVEEFAQMIVAECITVINQPNGVGDDDVIRISKDVEKHFGVEE